MADNVKVTFTADSLLESEGRGKGQEFKAGKTYEMRPDQAERWIRRNAAVYADPKPDPFPEVKGRKAKASDDADDADDDEVDTGKTSAAPVRPTATPAGTSGSSSSSGFPAKK